MPTGLFSYLSIDVSWYTKRPLMAQSGHYLVLHEQAFRGQMILPFTPWRKSAVRPAWPVTVQRFCLSNPRPDEPESAFRNEDVYLTPSDPVSALYAACGVKT